MFDLDQLIADCRAAVRDSAGQKAVREVVARAMREPGAVMRAIGEPSRAGLQKIYCGPDLTILNLVWGPMMTLKPHNHNIWAVIGIYSGREDNIFWRRIPEEDGSRVEAAGARSLCTGDVETLGRDIVHSVTNPIPRLTGALHVYGGDFFAPGRSEWDPETLRERPYDTEGVLRQFEASNAALGCMRPQ